MTINLKVSEDLLQEAIKVQQWEVAKGHLRALVRIHGSFTSSEDARAAEAAGHPVKWRVLNGRIEQFIRSIEEDGLHE